MPEWRRQDMAGEVIEMQIRKQGIWWNCMFFSTGQVSPFSRCASVPRVNAFTANVEETADRFSDPELDLSKLSSGIATTLTELSSVFPQSFRQHVRLWYSPAISLSEVIASATCL